MHPEDSEQLPWEEGEEEPYEHRDGQTVARGDVDGFVGAIRMVCTEVLTGDGGRRAHQSHRRPGDQRKQLRVRHRERRLRRGALRE